MSGLHIFKDLFLYQLDIKFIKMQMFLPYLIFGTINFCRSLNILVACISTYPFAFVKFNVKTHLTFNLNSPINSFKNLQWNSHLGITNLDGKNAQLRILEKMQFCIFSRPCFTQIRYQILEKSHNLTWSLA